MSDTKLREAALEFFTFNPDELMTRQDFATKFGRTDVEIADALWPLVAGGQLVWDNDTDADYGGPTYRLPSPVRHGAPQGRDETSFGKPPPIAGYIHAMVALAR